MNSFDASIISFLNSFAHRSWFFDNLMFLLSENYLLKGGVIVALIWWTWFRTQVITAQARRYLLCGMIASLLSIAVARSLANELPYRERPLRDPAAHFQLPYGIRQDTLINWSSFPSDHAAVFFALATSIFFAWRSAGILAFAHVLIVICFPRMYLGIHYPTDLLAGALIGISIASLSRIMWVRNSVGRIADPWLERSPCSFYTCLFLLTFQIATIFDPLRGIARFIRALLHTA